MPDLHETEEKRESAILAAVDMGEYDTEGSLAELAELCDTAGIDVAGTVTQKRPDMDRATCIGAGKLEEIAGYLAATGSELLLFDHELTATQLRNIEDATGVVVLDRTMLILEIFAGRARSHEGRIQVELARSRYLLPRLSGLGKNMSRLGGGGGGAGAGARRGAGETKPELDRRHIRRRIGHLEEELGHIAFRREQTRSRRKKDGVTTVAIVGYTNVGKSTLLNTLTDAGVLAEDKLFATLDPTARSLTLPDGRAVMLIDTVGLVRRLPHHLVEAFKSTLEEAVHADLLLHVCDLSSPDAKEQVEVTTKLLSELGVTETPVLTVLNKCDRVSEVPLVMGGNTAVISARTGFGLSELLAKIAAALEPTQKRMRLLIPYGEGGLVAEIRSEGKIFSEKFTEAGTELDALVDVKLIYKAEKYII